MICIYGFNLQDFVWCQIWKEASNSSHLQQAAAAASAKDGEAWQQTLKKMATSRNAAYLQVGGAQDAGRKRPQASSESAKVL